MNKPIKYKVLDYVPYQQCPVCHGAGRIQIYSTTSSVSYLICKVCDGAMIIPMCVVR